MAPLERKAEATTLDFVMAAFEQIGGEARLISVYPIVRHAYFAVDREVPIHLDELVRQTVYQHCPASPNYIGPAFFERYGRGKYRVRRPTIDDI